MAESMSDPDDELARFENARNLGADPLEALAAALTQGKIPTLEDALGLQGKTLRGYRLVRLLGIGGMGATYEGITGDGRKVAIKVVDALTASGRQRFANECRVLRMLSHEAIVSYVDDHLLEDGRGLLVMQYVAGLDFESVLADRGEDLTLDSRLEMLARIADALHHAHSQGVVHRDVKPQNILVNENNEALLIDFGLSRDLFEDRAWTRSGAVLGTLGYMAPEQVRGEDERIGPATDVFALGLVLYRALLGADLREDPADVLAHGKQPFLLPKGAQSLPVDLQAILYRSLDPDPRRRYPSSAGLAADLRAVVSGGRVLARRPCRLARWWRRHGGRSWLVGSGTLIAGAVLVTVIGQSIEPHRLSVTAINTPGILTLDGVHTLNVPFEDLPVTPGPHKLRYEGFGLVPLEHEFSVDRRHMHLNLLTCSLRSSSMPVFDREPKTPDPTRSWGFLHWNRILVPATRTLNGENLDPDAEWLALAAGTYVLSTRSASGAHESLSLEVRSGWMHDVTLIGELHAVPGSFRRTLQSVVSPLPRELELVLEDGVIPIVGTFDIAPSDQNTRFDRGKFTKCDTYLSPALAGMWLTAELRVRFPEPMRSITIRTRSEIVGNTGKLEVATRCDLEDWVPAPLTQSPDLASKAATLAIAPERTQRGVLVFAIRGRMKVEAASRREGHVLFLAGSINGSRAYGDDPPQPAFAIVADPGPR